MKINIAGNFFISSASVSTSLEKTSLLLPHPVDGCAFYVQAEFGSNDVQSTSLKSTTTKNSISQKHLNISTQKFRTNTRV